MQGVAVVVRYMDGDGNAPLFHACLQMEDA